MLESIGAVSTILGAFGTLGKGFTKVWQSGKLAKENKQLKKENEQITKEKAEIQNSVTDYENKIKEKDVRLGELEQKIKQYYEPILEANQQQIIQLDSQLNLVKVRIKGYTNFAGNCPHCNSTLHWKQAITLLSFVSTHQVDGLPFAQTSRGTTERALNCAVCNREFHVEYKPHVIEDIPI